MKLRTMLQGAGLAALLLFPFFAPVITDPSDLRMHSSAPLTGFAFSLIVNLVVAAIAIAYLGRWLRSSTRFHWVCFALPGLVIVLITQEVYSNMVADLPHRLLVGMFVVIVIATFLLQLKRPSTARFLLQMTGAVLLGLSMFFMFGVFQLARFATWQHAPNSTEDVAASKVAVASAPRIVWILFDELSYQQVFGDRFIGLQLPNFDRLRASSTLFSNVQPIATYTEKAIPSILLGRPINRVAYTSKDLFEVASQGQPLQAFNSKQTPFALAQQHGLTTGVAGWYIPYCSILAPYLNSCYWTSSESLPVYKLSDGFWRDVADPWIHYWLMSLQLWNYRGRTTNDLQFRIDTYKDLIQRSDEILRQATPDFIFLHLPLPHPPGFYNRKTGQLTASGDHSYIDNLALTDKTLGQLLAILQQSPRWKDTSIVVCGDHSWRIGIWDTSRYWTAEDEAASHGRVFDQRPLIMVHLAGQTTPSTVNATFPLVQLHGVLDDLVAGKQPSFYQ